MYLAGIFPEMPITGKMKKEMFRIMAKKDFLVPRRLMVAFINIFYRDSRVRRIECPLFSLGAIGEGLC